MHPPFGLAQQMNEADLKSIALRTAALTREIPQYRAILDVAAGAIFCLFRAHRLAYKHRESPLSDEYLQNLTVRLERMAEGRLPQTHGWLAGFYFNSAIQRIAAVGAQLVGILKRLDRQAKLEGQGMDALNDLPVLTQIRDEVNRFKHDETGLDRGRDITPSMAVTALSEIVETLENYKKFLKASHPQPRRR
jgi:hypothetical protein